MNNLPRLLQLCSQALPVGAYAYSQGLESAIHEGPVTDADSACRWIAGVYRDGIGSLDLPALHIAHRVLQDGRDTDLIELNEYLAASRETGELLLEDIGMGRALQRLLQTLEIEGPAFSRPSFVIQFAIAGFAWGIPASELATGFSFSWLENQVAVSIKSIPLGQSDAQKMLGQLIESIAGQVEQAGAVAASMPNPADWDFGQSLPALAILSSRHEFLEARLYRS